MNRLTKKRLKAILIDMTISSFTSLAVESLVPKKVKNDFFFSVISPTLTLWGLEYVQTRLYGQTIGQKVAGIKVENEFGPELSSEQIVKRMVHRDTISSLDYLRNRNRFDRYEGVKYPHDLFAYTYVAEKNN